MIKRNYLTIKFTLGIFLFLSSVFSTKLTAQVQSPNTKDTKEIDAASPSIICVLLEIEKNDENTEDIQITRSVIRPGRLKKDIDISPHGHTSGEELVCTVLDDNDRVLIEQAFAHPLVQTLEYEEEETGEIKRVEVPVEQQHFLIRLPYSAAYAALKFERQDEEGNRTFITKIKLDF